MVTTKEIEKETDGLRGSRFPVDLIEIAKNLGYGVYSSDDSSLSGKVDHTLKKIYVNKSEKIVRQRFTLAHELGHIVMHKKNNVHHHRKKNPHIQVYSDNMEEIEANKFASALLMPQKEFRKIWHAYGLIEYVAQYFDVSHQAATIRAVDLGLEGL